MQERKKICLVVSSMLIVKFFLLDHLERLSRHYDVTLLVNTSDLSVSEMPKLPIRLLHLEVERKISPKSDLRALAHLIRFFWRERFDLVHSISPKTGLLAMVAGALANVPIRLHTFQGEIWVARRGFWRVILKALDKLVARLATHLLVVSRSEQQFLLEQGVVPAGKSTVLANGSICGVDIQRFKPDPESRSNIRSEFGIKEGEVLFLYLGRLSIDKGLLDLAAAFLRVGAEQPNVHLAFVGPDEEGIQKKVDKICGESGDRVHFRGYTDKPEQYLSAADVLCLPSHREGFGMVIVEAAAVEVPAIGSRIYGITDAIVENQTGLLFEAGNDLDLSEKMLRLARDPALRKSMGKSAMVRAQHEFSRERVLSETAKYYKNLLAS
ncbi:MAG TPA: glycosyltransferase family 4 protein [Gallionellaceae bacterium]